MHALNLVVRPTVVIRRMVHVSIFSSCHISLRDWSIIDVELVGELQKLGIDVAKSTVERYRPRRNGPSSANWKTFLELHAKDLAPIDFFIVPTMKFKILFVFIVLPMTDAESFISM